MSLEVFIRDSLCVELYSAFIDDYLKYSWKPFEITHAGTHWEVHWWQEREYQSFFSEEPEIDASTVKRYVRELPEWATFSCEIIDTGEAGFLFVKKPYGSVNIPKSITEKDLSDFVGKPCLIVSQLEYEEMIA